MRLPLPTFGVDWGLPSLLRPRKKGKGSNTTDWPSLKHYDMKGAGGGLLALSCSLLFHWQNLFFLTIDSGFVQVDSVHVRFPPLPPRFFYCVWVKFALFYSYLKWI